MDPAVIGLIAFAMVLILLALRVPIAFALCGVATVATFFIYATRTGIFMPERAIRPTVSMIYSNSFDLIHSYELSMIPLFVALGISPIMPELRQISITQPASGSPVFLAVWPWPPLLAAAVFPP